jgi:hypothetical protein
MDFNDLCSFYFNVREQRCIEMSLEEFVNYICNGRWKSTVEMYHRLMAEGDKSKAKELKNKLPGLVVAGYCEGSHALKNRRTWSGNAMFDVDHTQGHTQEFLQKLKAVPWGRLAKCIVRWSESGGAYRGCNSRRVCAGLCGGGVAYRPRD